MTSSAAPSITGLHHVTLPVDNLAAAEAFYVGLLGATLLRRFDHETFVRFLPHRAIEAEADNSPLHIAVTFGSAPEMDLFLQRGRQKSLPAPHPHFALQVAPEELDAFIERLRAANIPIDGPRRLGPPGQASVYFADPFGNTLELVTMGYTGAVKDGPPVLRDLSW